MSWCGVSDECGIALRRERSDEADGKIGRANRPFGNGSTVAPNVTAH